jgi:hypothetical protein
VSPAAGAVPVTGDVKVNPYNTMPSAAGPSGAGPAAGVSVTNTAPTQTQMEKFQQLVQRNEISNFMAVRLRKWVPFLHGYGGSDPFMHVWYH